MMDLIEAIEKSTEPSRSFDALIEIEVRRWQAFEAGLTDKTRARWVPIGDRGEVICTQGITRYHPPVYTFKIDDALALVPPGHDWRVDTMTGLPGAIVCLPNSWLSHKTAPMLRHGATPALALCAAALRARSPSEKAQS